ncbi:MAG: hypothetical protein ACN6OD_07195 [Alcaligenes sp.]
MQALERFVQQRAVKGFLAREPGVNGAGGAAGFLGNCPYRRFLQPVALKNPLRGAQDQLSSQRVQPFVSFGACGWGDGHLGG